MKKETAKTSKAATKTTAKLLGGITQAQMDAWKAEHGDVFKIEVKVSGNDLAVCYLRKMTRQEKTYAAQQLAKSDVYGVGDFILRNCRLGGDKRFDTNDQVFDSAVLVAGNLFDFLPAELSEVV